LLSGLESGGSWQLQIRLHLDYIRTREPDRLFACPHTFLKLKHPDAIGPGRCEGSNRFFADDRLLGTAGGLWLGANSCNRDLHQRLIRRASLPKSLSLSRYLSPA